MPPDAAEGRLLRLVPLPLEGDEDDRAEDEPDRRELERPRQVVAHRAAICGAARGHRAHLLVDGAEDRRAVGVLHLDPDRVAEAHERRLRRAALDRLDRPLLGDARVAARPVLVADGAAADDRAGARVARLAQVRDQLAEVEGHLLAGVAQARALAVPGALEVEVQAAAAARRRRARRASPRPG